VSIGLPPFISTSRVEQMPGVPYDPNTPPDQNGFPPYDLMTFDNDVVTPSPFDINQRQMRILPVTAYLNMYSQANNPAVAISIQELQRILTEKPLPVPTGIPVLPAVNAVQALHAQDKYLSFTGGNGIAFVAFFSQGPQPVTNENLVYFFQGLSSDGTQYISMAYPVDSAKLPNTASEVPADVMQLATENHTQYLADTTKLLNEATPADFTPNLDQLHAMVASVTLGGVAIPSATVGPVSTQPSTVSTLPATTPVGTQRPAGPTATYVPPTRTGPTPTRTTAPISSEIVGTWFWTSLTKADGTDVKPSDPDKYSVQFKSDGTLSVKSDCNTASGYYKLGNSGKLTIDLTGGTTKDCGSESLSKTFTDYLEGATKHEINDNKMDINLYDGGRMRLSK
jgi:heat shock protein HslJ